MLQKKNLNRCKSRKKAIVIKNVFRMMHIDKEMVHAVDSIAFIYG